MLLLADFIIAGFARIATNPKAYSYPGSNDDVFAFARQLRASAFTHHVVPGTAHWERFENLCRTHGIVGSDQSDAYLAAFALEQDAELVTADREFRRFPGLRVLLLEAP